MEATFLFVPAHEERKAHKALASHADAVIFDLEAAVPDSQKSLARTAIRGYTDRPRAPEGPTLWVRVNSTGPHFDDDVVSIDWSTVEGAFVARAEAPGTLAALAAAGAKRLIPMIESARGLGAMESLAGLSSVERFAIGTWDLLLDLGLLSVSDPDQSELIWRIRGDLVVRSRQLEIGPPIDGVCARLDGASFEAHCRRAHQLGYAAKLLIHPNQISMARSIFGPDADLLRQSREILDAYEHAAANGIGVVRVNGMMVDLPMVERSRALLSRGSFTRPHVLPS